MGRLPQKLISLLLALALTAALLPASVLAEQMSPDGSAAMTEDTSWTEETVSAEGEPSDTDPQPEEPVAEEQLTSEDTAAAEPEDSSAPDETEPEDAEELETLGEQPDAPDASEEPDEEEEPAAAQRETVDSAAEVASLIGEHWDEGYFQQAVVDPKKNRVTVDGNRSTVSDVFGQEAEEADILDSAGTAEAYFEDTCYETEVQKDGTVEVTAPWQTRRIVVSAKELPEDYGAETILEYREYHQFVLQFATEEATQTAYDQLSGDYDCYVDQVFTAEDSLLEEGGTTSEKTGSWGAAYMGMEGLKQHSPFNSSSTASVAIIDTGCDVENDYFAGRSISAASRNLQDGSSDISDVTGHGTHVAGIVSGCTPDNVSLMILRVFDQSGHATLLTVDVALKYALEQQADVVNISLGQSTASGASNNHTLDDVLAAAKEEGVPVVCAAGNASRDVSATYPASSADTIAVSAVNRNGVFAATFSEEPDESVLGSGRLGSSYGEGIDFCAPGVNIVSAWPGGTNTQSGTSMASPHVAAAFAWLRLRDPTASVEQLYESLKGLCKDLGEPGKDHYYGWGCPDLSGLAENSCSHQWTAQVTEPTCTAKGYTEYTCQRCGKHYRRSYTAMIPHQLEEQGDGTAVCASCGQKAQVVFDGGLRWSYDGASQTLTVTGSGALKTAPWEGLYAPERIKGLVLEGVTGIGDELFSEYPVLKTAELGDSLESLGKNVFYGCTALQKVDLPASLTDIGAGALCGCTALESFTLDGKNTAFVVSSNGFLYNTGRTELIACAAGYTNQGNDYRYTVPASVKRIRQRAFDGCIHVATLILPTGLQEIGGEAFARCASLKTVYVKCDQPELGENLFTGDTTVLYVSQGLKGWDSALAPALGGTLTWKSYVGNLEDWIMTLSATEWSYTGNPRRPGIILTNGDTVVRNYSVKDGAGNVTSPANYADYFTFSYTNNTEPGRNTATAAVTGTKIYYGTQTLHFSIWLDTPEMTSLTTGANTVTVRWQAVDHAAKYRVLRRTGNGDWEQLGDTAKTSFTDKKPVSGEKNTYTVCCIGADGGPTSRISADGLGVAFVKAPELSGVQEVSGGIRVSWGAVQGAAQYRVFRRTGSGGWKKVGDTAKTFYTDRKPVSGEKNFYTVRCMDEDGDYISKYDTTGMSLDYVAPPVLSGAACVSGGIRVTWKTVPGASKYRVLCKTGSGGWKRVGDTKSASLIAKTSDGRTVLRPGTKYTFTVMCLSADGKSSISRFDTVGRSTVYVPAPSLTAAKNLKGRKLRVRWKKAAGATGYQVQYARNRRMRKGRIARTSAGAKVLSRLKKKKKYYVRVRAFKKVAGKTYYSGWSSVRRVAIKK